jgi:16S rRNA (uracil1498-N3)-methyltransferase
MSDGEEDMMPPMVRLFVDQNLAEGQTVEVAAQQAHYLGNVMRLKPGAEVALFNGRDGEFRATVASVGKRAASLTVGAQTRPQEPGPDLWLAFAPIKRTPIDYVAQKATELGVSALVPVITERTVVRRVNVERMRANAVEAAEQTGRLDVPRVDELLALDAALDRWNRASRILMCDETMTAPPIADVLPTLTPGPWAILIGPEGGFAPEELDRLGKTPFVTRVGLGPRLLRADTAALAALSCWQALIGDWRQKER